MKLTEQDKLAIVRMLLSDRLENYGYDYRDWKRLVQQRYRAKRELKLAIGHGSNGHSLHLEGLAWDQLTSRITVKDGRAEYVVGQSSNEEITNVMRQLVNPLAPWVS